MSSKLRYGLNCLWPSAIGEQQYCEYKIHLGHTHPAVEIEIPSLTQGELGHAEISKDAKPITTTDLERAIQEGQKVAICEWMLEGSHRDVPIRGRPDLFAFQGKQANLLLELKFTSAKTPFPSQSVQAELYAFLADCSNFVTHDLFFGLVFLPPYEASGKLDATMGKELFLRASQMSGVLDNILSRCEEARLHCLSRSISQLQINENGWKAFLCRYNRERIEKDLDQALPFWLNERDPVPTTGQPKKCFPCVYNAAGLCPHAQHKPDHRIRVEVMPDGRIVISR